MTRSVAESMLDQQSWVKELPDYNEVFSAQGTSLVRSFSLFSLFRTTSKSPPLAISSLDGLFSLADDITPDSSDITKALSSFSTFITQLKDHLADVQGIPICLEDVKLLDSTMAGYSVAFGLVSRLVWGEDKSDLLERTMEDSLKGFINLYSRLCRLPEDYFVLVPNKNLDLARLAILSSTFHDASQSHQHLVGLFQRGKKLLTTLQTASRPMAHSKLTSKGGLPPPIPVSETDALQVISLLHVFGSGIDTIDRLEIDKKSKTKAQKEQDARRPLRISLEARLLACDVTLSMATRDIKMIQRRAKKALSVNDSEDEEDEKSIIDEDIDQGIVWEAKVEKEMRMCLEAATELLEERRGGVLSDKVERGDWLGEEIRVKAESSHLTDTEDDTDSDEDSEKDSESEEEAVDMYPCPLRSLFRLHDRYEEQRLAVWMSLPAANRGGMGICMRGEGGKIGEAWDALGLLFLLDYDSETLMNFGLSVDKLDKWLDLASRRNAKKIRRRKGRKSV